METLMAERAVKGQGKDVPGQAPNIGQGGGERAAAWPAAAAWASGPSASLQKANKEHCSLPRMPASDMSN